MSVCEPFADRVVVRNAVSRDVTDLLHLGHETSRFAVSDEIRFYEEFELQEWIADPAHNIVLVAFLNDHLEGFLYCKLMSSHWALLDNFYCTNEAARIGAGRILFDDLLLRLRGSGHAYLTALIRADHAALIRLCRHYGFVLRDGYKWMDMFL